MSTSIDQTRKELDEAFNRYCNLLKDLCIEATQSLSRAYPKNKVTFCSAMGSWGWTVGKNWPEVKESHFAIRKAAKAMQQAYDDYQWQAIPTPIMVIIENGKTEIKFMW